MSAEPTRVTQGHFDYIAAHAEPEDEFSRRLKQAARDAGLPAIWISHTQALTMRILLRAAAAKRVIEVGALGGYSAIQMARALPAGGQVVTIEISPKHAEFARSWARQSDVADKVDVRLGAGMDILPGFRDNEFDAAFLDADKSSYPRYLRECMRIVRPGGLILADNAFAFGQLLDAVPTDREVAAIREFNEYVPTIPGLSGVILPVGDGLWMAVKTAGLPV